MNIDEVFTRVKYLANKSGYLGYISPNDFNSLYAAADRMYFNKMYAQYAATQRISDSLSPFVRTGGVTIDGAGQYTLPADVIHISAIWSNFENTKVQVKRVESDRLANNISSSYDAPNSEFPIYIQYNGYIQFYPVNLGAASITTLNRPTTAKWDYTLVGNRPVYSASSSVQPQWKDTDIDNVIYLMLADLGINMRDGELEAFAQTEIKQAT